MKSKHDKKSKNKPSRNITSTETNYFEPDNEAHVPNVEPHRDSYPYLDSYYIVNSKKSPER